jgi:hypothetical protein
VFKISHRLFIVYGHRPVQELRDLNMNSTSRHVAVLGHRHLRVAKVIRTDPRRQALVVDQGQVG